MALPKRKLSRSRTRHRRAQWLRIPVPTTVACARCTAPVRPHTVCAACGTYDGRTVLEV
jgi:large subunit ribosomal protein L32